MNRAVNGALDVLLTDAGRDGRSMLPRPGTSLRVSAAVARRPDRVARRTARLAGDLTRIAAGRSELAPARGDRRFADETWKTNPLFRRLMQSYLAVDHHTDGFITDADLDWRTERRARFAATNLLDALAPTNYLWSNPTAVRTTVDERGANLARGARQFGHDIRHTPRLPQTVDPTAFMVGDDLATTPGSIVLRTDVFELIHYRPQTAEVRAVATLIIPPTINKYYVLDLAPGRSLIEHLVRSGQPTFAVSWRNPDAEQGHFDLDTYAEAVLEARDAVAAITGADAVNIAAACSGGIISACALGHLAAEGRAHEVASLTLLVCALDNERAGTTSALTSREVAAAAVAQSARKGYLDGRALAGVFAWLRPNDLIWSYVVNNYLLGRRPPAVDVLFWSQDTVRLAAGLHRDFIRLALDNSLTRPGGLDILDSPIDLGAVDRPVYIVAALNDHIVPWENAYRSTGLLGGDCRVVLSSSGHVQALVNPPVAGSRSSYRVGDDCPNEPEAFLDIATTHEGSWWPDWTAWLDERAGALTPAPSKLGAAGFKPRGKAPGTYVHAA